MNAHTRHICRLYRQSLRTSLDWIVERDQWRQCAVSIRLRIEENRYVADPKAVAMLTRNFEQEVKENAHPDPYRPPSAPGGILWERNKLWENKEQEKLLF
ncbi:hypothetical protein IWQ60_008230 [Tieghemiomyces parasiticus]|uniref:NADH dehydrogenase [ubiquinone] 1 beta subcomplex subunit 9 n=1 Tax=Tieghemiomyces parasiticus TaxID=78921 RepID=A0A9W8DS44_9FUNG|nr:hypothetical protein IWQ60_008230 [Tieghemiomyces parasiticus]